MRIEEITVHAEEADPHGFVFFATAYAVATAINGLSPGKKEPVGNWFDVTVKNHYGYVTAGHAVTMLIKKCRRMTMRPDTGTIVKWTDPGLICPLTDDTPPIDEKRMNSIIKDLGKRHKLTAVLPYETPVE